MRAQVLTSDELTEKDLKDFWAQDVCMDDWDYVVLAPVETISFRLEPRDKWDEPGPPWIEWEQNEYTFERIMVGCCNNKWYKAKFRGEEYAVGVAYHS